MTKPEPSAPALLIEADTARNQGNGHQPASSPNHPPRSGGRSVISSEVGQIVYRCDRNPISLPAQVA